MRMTRRGLRGSDLNKYIVHDFMRVASFTYLEEAFASLVTCRADRPQITAGPMSPSPQSTHRALQARMLHRVNHYR